MRIGAALLLLACAGPALGQTPRPGDVLSAGDAGVRCDGTSDVRAALNDVIEKASASGGGTVMLPRGVCRIDMLSGFVVPRSNVTLAGQGMGATVVLADDSGGKTGVSAISNYTKGWEKLDRFTLRDLTLRGKGDTLHSYNGGGPLRLGGTNLVIERVESLYSRGFGLAILAGSDVVVRDSRVFRSMADGIAVWDTANAIISGNEVIQANDDSISAHSQDASGAPVRSGVQIINNTITEGGAITMLGAKVARIAGNVLRRPMGVGIAIRTGRGGYAQGNTAMFSVAVENNVIEDVFRRSETPPMFGGQAYIIVDGGVAQAGDQASVPGLPAAGSGTVTPLYGAAGSGTFYATGTTKASVASPGPYGLTIRDNVLHRSLPAVSQVSQWGYESSAHGLWIGAAGDGSGYYNGAIAEGALRTPGIVVNGPLRNTLIDGNVIDTSGSNCIYFNAAAGFGAHDLDGLVISGNRCSNFGVGGFWFTTPAASPQRVLISGNTIDGDPHFSSGARGPHGAWQSGSALPGIAAPSVVGLRVERNSFRNLGVADVPVTDGLHEYAGNLQIGAFVAMGFSAGNKGLGTWQPPDAGWDFLVEDSDPASATYGQVLFAPVRSAAAQPGTGIWPAGAFVSAAPGAAGPVCGMTLLGWRRVTTGTGNGAGDWEAVRAKGSGGGVALGLAEGGRLTLPGTAADVFITTTGALAAAAIVLPDPAGVPAGCEVTVAVGALTVARLSVVAASGAVQGAPAAIGAHTPFGFRAVSPVLWERSR